MESSLYRQFCIIRPRLPIHAGVDFVCYYTGSISNPAVFFRANDTWSERESAAVAGAMAGNEDDDGVGRWTMEEPPLASANRMAACSLHELIP